jgi:hypothetical protein
VSSSSGYLKIILKAMPIKIAPQRTPGPARTMMFNKDFLNTYQSQLKAELILKYLIQKLALG